MDIYDEISQYLSDADLGNLLLSCREVVVSAHLLRDRKRAYWRRCGADNLAEKGNLLALQFLHSIDMISYTSGLMKKAAGNAHLPVVKFLHSIGVPYGTDSLYYAASNGHLAVLEFLHDIYNINLSYIPILMYEAAYRGHLNVVKFLYNIGPKDACYTMVAAAITGHLPVVEFLYSVGVPCTERAMKAAFLNNHLDLVNFFKANS